MTAARDRLVRWSLLGLPLLVAGVAGALAAVQLSGAVGVVVAGFAAVITVVAQLVLDGPWNRLQGRRSQLRAITYQLRAANRSGLPLVRTAISEAMTSVVHPSIPLPGGADEELAPDHPAYITRTFDHDLHRLLRNPPIFPVLTGPSAAGKSRAALAAIARVLPDWRLCWPPSAGHLKQYVSLGGPPKQTVVLLDELNTYLLGADALDAATIEQLLRPERHIVVIGTMNNILFDDILASSNRVHGVLLSAEARQLLRRCTRVDVDPEFSTEELKGAQALAADPRVAEALAKADGRVTEYFAAVPALCARYKTGIGIRRGQAALGARVVRAAVMCRLTGYQNPVPAALLREATLSLLTHRERGTADRSWFDQAVEWACEPVRGEVSLLAAIADTPGVPEGYELHDAALSLATRAGPSADAWTIPQPMWELVAAHCTADNANPVGYAAALAGQLACARIAWSKAAAAGDRLAKYNLGTLLQNEGDLQAAEALMREGAEAGGAEAMSGYGVLLAERGATAEAEAWLAKSAATGSPEGMYNFASLLYKKGELARALRWFEKAANYGIVPAVYNLGHILEESDDPKDVYQAIVWFLRGADQLDDPDCRFRLGSLYFKARQYSDAERHYRIAADAGHAAAMGQLGWVLMVQKTGRIDEAEQWMRRAVAAGHTPSILNLSNVMKLRGRFDEASELAAQWRHEVKDGFSLDGMELVVQPLTTTRSPHDSDPSPKKARRRASTAHPPEASTCQG